MQTSQHPTRYLNTSTIQKKADEAKVYNTAWSLSRLGITQSEVSMCSESQTMPSWNAANSLWTEENIPMKVLAFLPVLP